MSEPELPERGTREWDFYVANTVKLHRMGPYEPEPAEGVNRVRLVSRCEACQSRMDRDETDPSNPKTLGYAYFNRCRAAFQAENPPNDPEIWY